MDMRRLAVALSLLLTLNAAASNDLSGVVVDAESKPVANAHVYVYSAAPKTGLGAICPTCYRDCGKHEPVDASGAFRLGALDPTLLFDVLAVADGYEPTFAKKVDPVSGAVTIKLTPRSLADADHLITGTVVDYEGKPVLGAIVEPNGYRSARGTGFGNIPGLDKLSITNAKGEFALRIPDASGKLDVRATGRSLAPRIERMFVPGQPRKIALTPGAGISGRVLRDGKPLAGVPVHIVQENRASTNFLGQFEIATNEDGFFVLTYLGPDETYVVSMPVEGGGVVEPKVVKVGADDSTTDAGTFPVVRGRRIAGTVVLPAGQSVPPKTLIGFSSSGSGYTSEVAPDGRFAFDEVPHGSGSLSLFLGEVTVSPESSWFDPNEDTVVVPPQGDCTDLRLVLAEE
jgi:hypothetical protein